MLNKAEEFYLMKLIFTLFIVFTSQYRFLDCFRTFFLTFYALFLLYEIEIFHSKEIILYFFKNPFFKPLLGLTKVYKNLKCFTMCISKEISLAFEKLPFMCYFSLM